MFVVDLKDGIDNIAAKPKENVFKKDLLIFANCFEATEFKEKLETGSKKIVLNQKIRARLSYFFFVFNFQGC